MISKPGTLKLNAMPYVASFWLIMIIGNVLPFYTNQPVPLGINSITAALLTIPLVSRTNGFNLDRHCLVAIYIFLVIFSVGMLRTSDITYAVLKIDSAILTPLLLALLATECIKNHGVTATCKAMCWALVGLLMLTIVYKLHFGFFDRTVRFFLNGPIVFSWAMGVLAILSLHLGATENRKLYYLFFAMALLAVFWSMSKGPLLALFATLTLYFVNNLTNKKILAAFSVAVTIIAATVYLLKDELLSSRYMALIRFSNGHDVDQGSVGSRMGMWAESIDIAYQNPVLGVGLGNWQFHTNSGFIYPHNFALELASEMGIIVAFCVILIMVIATWKIRPHPFYPVALFLIACLLFSGDVTYLRYPLAFLIAAYSTRHLLQLRQVPDIDFSSTSSSSIKPYVSS